MSNFFNSAGVQTYSFGTVFKMHPFFLIYIKIIYPINLKNTVNIYFYFFINKYFCLTFSFLGTFVVIIIFHWLSSSTILHKTYDIVHLLSAFSFSLENKRLLRDNSKINYNIIR